MTDDTETKARTLHARGQSPSQIAAWLGTSVDEVRVLLGLPTVGQSSVAVRPRVALPSWVAADGELARQIRRAGDRSPAGSR